LFNYNIHRIVFLLFYMENI